MMAAPGVSPTTTAHDDTREFIRGLEMTARKVLTNANKKRMQELRRQQSLARRLGTDPEDDPPKTFVVEVPPGVDDWGNQLASKTMEIGPTGMTVGVRATRRQHRPMDAEGVGFPTLGDYGINAAESGDVQNRAPRGGRKLPQISRRPGGLTLSTPVIGQTRGEAGENSDRAAAAGGKKAVRAGVPAAKIDRRLTSSPFFSASMTDLTKPVMAAHQDDDPLSGVAGGGTDEEEVGGIANMRVVNASKVIGHGRFTGQGPMAIRKLKGNKGSAEREGQGVTSWSSDDLRVKYRAEREREEAYQAFRLEEQVAEALEKDYGQVVAVPEVDRHPLYVGYYVQLERENSRCLQRASARNKMKRFITDVHTVWLTNLSHHPEFRKMVCGAALNQDEVGVGGGGSGANGTCYGHGDIVTKAGVMNQSETAATPGATSRRGLDGGRDTAAIAGMQSQIQSVRPELAFRGAVFCASDARDSSSYPRQPGAESISEREGHHGEQPARARGSSVLDHSARDDDEGGEAPRLTPPPFVAPGLAVLVAERHRLAALPNTGGGGRKNLRDDGSRRQSFAGGGVGDSGDTGSWLDASARVLRVLRFAPPSPPAEMPVKNSLEKACHAEGSDGRVCATNGVASRTAATEQEGEREAARFARVDHGDPRQNQRVPSLAPAPEATWMISSFHPHDGSEDRVTIRGVTVAKVVGETLSSRFPLAAAGLPDSSHGIAGKTEAQAGAVRPTGSPGITSLTPKERKDGETRVLLLRRGVRVPVLGEGGGIIGKAPSVVEVFASPCPLQLSTRVERPGRSSLSSGTGHADGSGGRGEGEEDAARIAATAAGNVMLEVTAYPAGLFPLTKESGERERAHRRLRGEGRRRVVLTAEGLWQRRRLVHPSAALSEKTPLGLRGWLGRERGDGADTPYSAEEDGNQHGVVVEGSAENNAETRGHGVVGERPQTDGKEAGGGAQESLDDLVNMVAFGPPDDGEDRRQGLFATALPLLLRPAQSFGPEGRTRIGGGSASVLPTASLLTEESMAEVLLSLVRLGSAGRGRSPAIAVEGIASSLITADDSEKSLAEAWEEEADRVEPLSMRVSGRRNHTREVPGTCNFGKMGITFSYTQAPERTQAVASFFRDATMSSSDSVMVLVALALDTPKLTPLVIAWDREPVEPEAAPDEDALDMVPGVMIPPGAVIREGVVSELGSMVAPDAFILTNAEQRADYSLPDNTLAAAGGSIRAAGVGGRQGAAVQGIGAAATGEAGATAAGVSLVVVKHAGIRHRRGWRETDDKGFRRYAVYRLLEPDGHMQPLGFGVSKRATLPNTAAVCGRSTFHSEQRCTEQLCRQRTAKDYAYVSANDEHRGPGDPGSYSVACKHERMVALLRTGLERYNAEVARVAAERERQAKDAALQAKLEIGKAQLANRRAREDAAARTLARKADAQHLKVSTGASKIRHQWELRMQDSHVLEARGSWEKRRDSGGSAFYYCKSEEGLPEPFSWDPPECWDALDPDAMAQAEAAAADGASLGEGSGSAAWACGVEAGALVTEQYFRSSSGYDDDGDGVVSQRPLDDDKKLEMAVDRLAGNEKLLEALAWRLGIPLADVRPDGREPPLARDPPTEDDEELDENREQIEVGEHDDASDSDCERGDALGPPGPLPQDHSDLRRMRVAERRRRAKEDLGFGHKQPERQCIVPRLPLAEKTVAAGAASVPAASPRDGIAGGGLESQLRGLGWRRLARADLGQKFMERVVNPRVQGPRPEAVNTRPKPRPTSMTDPSKATKSSQEWFIPVDTMFVADVVTEHARILQEAERRMRKEELLDDSSAGPFDPATFAANGPQEFTTVERRMIALAEVDGRRKEEIQEEDNKAKAVIAAKTGNLTELEGLLYDNVPPDTKDSNGNTLLLLAAQQGNKRIIKFLLRKGATMNLQNMDGNTVLHFCYSHGHQALAEYLKSKGADDSLLNSEGLTCYEGLHAERVANI